MSVDDDEAALLAELRAISNKSAVSRFADDDDDDKDDFNHASTEPENRSPSNGERTVTHEGGVTETPLIHHEGESVNDVEDHDDEDNDN